VLILIVWIRELKQGLYVVDMVLNVFMVKSGNSLEKCIYKRYKAMSKCKTQDCKLRPSYGLLSDNKRLYCSTHGKQANE